MNTLIYLVAGVLVTNGGIAALRLYSFWDNRAAQGLGGGSASGGATHS